MTLVRNARQCFVRPRASPEFLQVIHRQGTKDTKASADTLSYDVLGAAINVHVNSDLVCSNQPMKRACVASCLYGRSSTRDRVPLPLSYRGMAVDCGYRVDLIVGGLMLVEVKAVTKVLPIHRAQAMTYIKLLKLNLAFVINFNVERLNLGIYRIVMS